MSGETHPVPAATPEGGVQYETALAPNKGRNANTEGVVYPQARGITRGGRMSYKLLRQVVADKIIQNEESIERLRNENEQLRRELAALDAPTLGPVLAESKGEERENPYTLLGPQEAVLSFLKGNLGSHTTAAIRNAVIAGGMKTESKNPHSVVYTALKRLADHGTVKKMPGGRWKIIPSSS